MELLIVILVIVILYYAGKMYIRHKIRKFFGQFGGQFNGTQFGGGQSQQQQNNAVTDLIKQWLLCVIVRVARL